MSDTDRRASLILGLGMAALALVLCWIAWESALSFARNLAAGRTVEVRTGAGAAAIGAVQLALLVAMLLRSPSRAQPRLLRAVLVLSPLLVLLPLALLLAADMLLPGQGYARCQPVSGQRFLTNSWAPVGAPCPN